MDRAIILQKATESSEYLSSLGIILFFLAIHNFLKLYYTKNIGILGLVLL
jgi:hypothetical protein